MILHAGFISTSDAPSYSNGCRGYLVKKKEVITYKDEVFYSLFFLLEGNGKVKYNKSTLQIKEKEMVFIARSASFRFTSTSENSLVIMFPFESLPPVCHKDFFQALFTEVTKVEHHFTKHTIHPALTKYLSLLTIYMNDGMKMDDIYPVKHYELFSLLRFYYSREQLLQLLHPMLNASHKFRQQIYANVQNVTGAKELMDACGMKRTTFERRFKEEFGISAHQWILKQKAEAVGESLANPNASIEEIRIKHRFNSATHFVRFCRQQFNCTPTEYRKRVRKMNSLPSGTRSDIEKKE